MKQSNLIVLGGALASLIAIPQMAAFFARGTRAAAGALRETDEIRQTLKLTPGTRVEISSIRGPVDIETSNSDTAEILITRTADSRTALQQDKIKIENTAGRLIVRGEPERTPSGNSPDVSHHAKLKLPRDINLATNSIAGAVTVGDLDGQLEVNSVSGAVTVGRIAQKATLKSISGDVNLAHVGGPLDLNSVSGTVTLDQLTQRADIRNVSGNLKIAQAGDSLDISSVSGRLSAGIAKLGIRGVQISNVSQQVELRFKGDVGAQLSTKNISHDVAIDLPNVTIEEKSTTAMRARIGNGGPPISISSVSGGVRLVLDTQTRSQD